MFLDFVKERPLILAFFPAFFFNQIWNTSDFLQKASFSSSENQG